MTAYAQFIFRHRVAVVLLSLLITVVLGFFAAGMKIVVNPSTLVPQQHPYIQSTKAIERWFGSKYMVVIGVTPKTGSALQPAVINRVQQITKALQAEPGVVRASLMSLTAPRAKGITATAEGFEAKPLIDSQPLDAAAYDKLVRTLRENPLYLDGVISKDFKTAAIVVEMKERSDGFRVMMAPIERIVQAQQSDDVRIAVSGSPAFTAVTEAMAERINWLFPVAVLVIGLLHFEAFRTWQGLVLPLVTALMAVVWGMGVMGLFGQTLDIFNSPTPILILAVAAGHAVQLLKRYYEDYEVLRGGKTPLSPEEANIEAVVRSMASAGPVMMVAGGVAVLGFLSLLVFRIETIRAFGLFTAVGIAGAVVLEMTFIPALRCMLRPPSDRERGVEAKARLWDRIPATIAEALLRPAQRRMILGLLALGVALSVVGATRVVVDSDYQSFFTDDVPVQRDNAHLNQALAGTSSLYVMFEGDQPDAVKDPAFLQALRSVQQYALTQSNVGKAVSIVDFLERMHRAMNGDKPRAEGATLPATREGIAQYLLLYSLSGDPGDFDAYVDADYQRAKLLLLLKTSGSFYNDPLVRALQAKAQEAFAPLGGHVKVSFGGDMAQGIALSDTMVQGKLFNIAQIAAAIFIISAIALRSLLAGVLVLVPLAVAVAAVFGVMGWTGTPLNVPNSLISAMAVGIGADYAIYLLFRMREFVRQGLAAEEALRRTLATAGKATLFVSTAVAGGYGVLALSLGFKVHQWLSGFIVLAMLVSALAALTLVPAAVMAWRPRFIFGGPQPVSKVVPGVPAMAFLVALGLAQMSTDSHAQTLTAQQWMQRSQLAVRQSDSTAVATMTLTPSDGSPRVRRMQGLTKLRNEATGDQMRLVRFLAPADIKGSATLMIERSETEDDLWVWLPALGKVRRLSAANKRDAFFGTDLTYGDVIGHRVDDWKHTLLREEPCDGGSCVVIESLPASETVTRNTGYGKRVNWVRKDNAVTVRSELFDADGKPFKRITSSDVRTVGKAGKWQVMNTKAENLQTGHVTTLVYDSFEADKGLSENLFTTKELEK